MPNASGFAPQPLGRHERRWEGADRSARKPGDLPPTAKPDSPRGKGWLISMFKRLAGLAAGLAVLVAAPAALAAPVTVDLRIEGASSTLFEGPVTTDIRAFRFTGDATAHQCDGTTTGTSPSPVPTARRGARSRRPSRRRSASRARGRTSSAPRSTSRGPEHGLRPGSGRFLAEYKNDGIRERRRVRRPDRERRPRPVRLRRRQRAAPGADRCRRPRSRARPRP